MKDNEKVATLTIRNAPALKQKDVLYLVNWLRRQADALLTLERLKLSNNYTSTLYKLIRK